MAGTQNLTLSIGDATAKKYSEFLETLRKNLTRSPLILPGESDVKGKYSLVDLSYNSKILTLAFDVVSLNLVAFQFDTKSYFFSNTTSAVSKLFDKTEKLVMAFSNTYNSLGNRGAVKLGISALQIAFSALTTYSLNDTSIIKTSLINVIGMVFESARFNFIEHAVTKVFDEDIQTDLKIISYEDNWAQLSKNIQLANENGIFPVPVYVKNTDGTTATITTVGEVKGMIGIRKHYAPTSYNLDNATAESYSEFLVALRGMFTVRYYTSGNYTAQVLGSESDVRGHCYSTVDIYYKQKPVTLALNVVNLNLVAFKFETKSYFFENTVGLMEQLFHGTEQVEMGFTNSYASLGTRRGASLGMAALQDAIDTLSNYESAGDVSLIKTSLITVMGMLSEAARFILIGDIVSNGFYTKIEQTIEMISYEDAWNELSKNIQGSIDGNFPSAVYVKVDDATTRKITTVAYVEEIIGILNYYPPMEIN